MNCHIQFRGVPLDVDFTVEAGQKEIIAADPNDSQEGFDPLVEIESVQCNGVEISELLSDKALEELADKVFEGLQGDCND